MARKQSTTRAPIKWNFSARPIGFDRVTSAKADSISFASVQGSTKEASTDLDSTTKAFPESIASTLRPVIEQQVSVLSTDSGFLPKDIQDSSFVDDVFEELNFKGICHSDIISCQDCQTSSKEPQPIPFHAKSRLSCRQKSENVCHEDGPAKKKPLLLPGTKVNATNGRRKKNNEASRRSRATRKKGTLMKEEEITKLKEDNQRLSILLQDFNSIVTSSKHWIVQKMESAD